MKGSTPLTQTLTNICDTVMLQAEAHRALAPILLLLVTHLQRFVALFDDMFACWKAGLIPPEPATPPRATPAPRPLAPVRATASPRIRSPRVRRTPAVVLSPAKSPRPQPGKPSLRPARRPPHRSPPRAHNGALLQKVDFAAMAKCA